MKKCRYSKKVEFSAYIVCQAQRRRFPSTDCSEEECYLFRSPNPSNNDLNEYDELEEENNE